MGHVRGTDEESISSNGDLERDLSSLKTIIEVLLCPMCAQVRHMGGRAAEESAGACFGRRSAAAPQWWAGCGEQRAMLLLVSQLLFFKGSSSEEYTEFFVNCS